MKCGLIVDGRAEREALPHLLRRIEGIAEVSHPLLYVDIQPTAPVPRIAREVAKHLATLRSRAVTRAIVLIDFEGNQNCPGDWGRSIGNLALRMARQCSGLELEVVVKHRKLENWLLSDPEALMTMPGRFEVSQNARSLIVPDKADRCDAEPLLKRIVRGDYRKREDAIRILAAMDPLRAAANSRSLRRLLRVLGHPGYSLQSRSPVRSARP